MSGTDNMKKWNDLSMAERAKYIQLGVQSGITNLSNIRNIYNSFAEGGHINKYDGTTEPSQQMNMSKPEVLKQIDWEQTYDPNSPYYINPESRRDHRQYSRTGEPIIPFSWYKTWAHPETGQLVSLEEARNYGHNVIDPETGEETLELLNPMLDELTVPSWKEAVKYVKRPTGGGALGTFEVKYKRANNERFSANPYDYNPKDDLGPIDAIQDNEQYLKYLDEHPVDDPADNFLNQLPFDLLTLGTSSAAKQGLKLGWNAFNKLGQKTVSGLSKLTPSNLMKGVASYAPKSWTPTLNTLGYLGDAGMFAYGVNSGINSVRYGIENNDPWQITAGGLETALGISPVFGYNSSINKLKKTISSSLDKLNWRPFLPYNPNRYYRIVGSAENPHGDAILDAYKTGIIRSNASSKGISVTTPDGKVRHYEIGKTFSYPMFSKGHVWRGSTNGAGKKYRIIRSKADTGPIKWEESNIDFRHKGHKGIYRPSYYGEQNAAPAKYFEYWEPSKIFGWNRRDFVFPFPPPQN